MQVCLYRALCDHRQITILPNSQQISTELEKQAMNLHGETQNSIRAHLLLREPTYDSISIVPVVK